MMKDPRGRKMLKGLKEVFQKPKYSSIAIIIAFIFFSLNMLFPNLKTLGEIATRSGVVATVKFAAVLIEGGFMSMAPLALYSLMFIALLLGTVASLIIYKTKMNRMFFAQSGKATTIGAMLGLVAPGCASCGIGVLSALGLTSTLTILPFQGTELSVLSIILLGTSTMSLAEKIADGNSCKIDFSKKKR